MSYYVWDETLFNYQFNDKVKLLDEITVARFDLTILNINYPIPDVFIQTDNLCIISNGQLSPILEIIDRYERESVNLKVLMIIDDVDYVKTICNVLGRKPDNNSFVDHIVIMYKSEYSSGILDRYGAKVSFASIKGRNYIHLKNNDSTSYHALALMYVIPEYI